MFTVFDPREDKKRWNFPFFLRVYFFYWEMLKIDLTKLRFILDKLNLITVLIMMFKTKIFAAGLSALAEGIHGSAHRGILLNFRWYGDFGQMPLIHFWFIDKNLLDKRLTIYFLGPYPSITVNNENGFLIIDVKKKFNRKNYTRKWQNQVKLYFVT